MVLHLSVKYPEGMLLTSKFYIQFLLFNLFSWSRISRKFSISFKRNLLRYFKNIEKSRTRNAIKKFLKYHFIFMENFTYQKRLLIKPSGHERQTYHDMVWNKFELKIESGGIQSLTALERYMTKWRRPYVQKFSSPLWRL